MPHPLASRIALPHALGRRRLADLGHAEVRHRVDDRVDHRRRGRDRAGLADALDAERVRGRRVTVRSSSNEGISGRGHEVLGHRPGDEVAGLVVQDLLVQGLGDPERDAAVHLPVDDHRVHHHPAVVDRDVPQQLGLPSRCRPRRRVGPERPGEVLRVPRRDGREVGLVAVGEVVRRPGRHGQLGDRSDLVGRPLHAERPVPRNSRSSSATSSSCAASVRALSLIFCSATRSAAPRSRSSASRTCPSPGVRSTCRRGRPRRRQDARRARRRRSATRPVSWPCPCGEVPILSVTLPEGLASDLCRLPAAGHCGLHQDVRGCQAGHLDVAGQSDPDLLDLPLSRRETCSLRYCS